MDHTTEELLDQVLAPDDPDLRRAAFVALVRSEEWRQVLAPHVLSRQGAGTDEEASGDWAAFREAAPYIAESEARVQRCLELAGARFSGELLVALAERMRGRLVEPALDHLRTAEGNRAFLLMQVLHQADPRWVAERAALPFLRRQMRVRDMARTVLMDWLAAAGILDQFVDELRQYPPIAVQEWSALGRAKITDPKLITRAIMLLPQTPAPLTFLLRQGPVDSIVSQRMLACAKDDWVMAALETAIIDGLSHDALIPLAELGITLGGQALTLANTWIQTSHLSSRLLGLLIEKKNVHAKGTHLWIPRRLPSPDRALKHGRQGKEPDLADAAALVREVDDSRVAELVREILVTPRPRMIDAVLHPLCAVNREAAREVIALCNSESAEVAARARAACCWSDVVWPGDTSA
jgi:hypothetical protein